MSMMTQDKDTVDLVNLERVCLPVKPYIKQMITVCENNTCAEEKV
jgi:hypothetical protein